MKKVLFVINTEGHLLSTASLVFEQFNARMGFEPYVLQVGTTGGKGRFKNETSQPLLTSHYLEVDPADMRIRELLADWLLTPFERVFLFLEQLPLNVFLAHHFKKSGSVICLGPDGNKPYFTVDRLALGSRVKQTLHTYRYLRRRGLPYRRPYFLSWNYARLNPVDEVWLTYPEAFNNVCHKKVVGFTLLPNAAVTAQVSAFFRIHITDDLPETDGVIFYANNILYRQELYDAEMEALRYILQKHPGIPFYLKYHPATPAAQLERFRELGVVCFSNSKPAELYIAGLRNSIVLGCWSASLMVNNPSCRFYWMYNYLVKKGLKVQDLVNLVNPTRHIRDVDNLDAITF